MNRNGLRRSLIQLRNGVLYAARRFWCGVRGHRWERDIGKPGVPTWCGRCNWWGGFTVMSIEPPPRRTARRFEFGRDEIPLTSEERAVWGRCPSCGADDGEVCIAELGIRLGAPVSISSVRREGVHLGRLQAAPKTARISFS